MRGGPGSSPTATLLHHSGQCRSVEYTADGAALVSASFDGTVVVSPSVPPLSLTQTAASAKRVLAGHCDRVVQARPHPLWPAVRMLLSCSVDKTVRLWA